jgi:hypothetical protein
MRALKVLVYGMGVLIVLAILLLSYGFYTRITNPEFRVIKDGEEEAPPQPAADGGFGRIEVPLPQGCTVVEIAPDGALLYLRTGPAGVCERILVIDTADGRLRGSIVLTQ